MLDKRTIGWLIRTNNCLPIDINYLVQSAITHVQKPIQGCMCAKM